MIFSYIIGGETSTEYTGLRFEGSWGALLSLLGIQGDKVFITQLIRFWDPSTVTFKFLNFEITPTLEEFSSFTELSIRGRLPMIHQPYVQVIF